MAKAEIESLTGLRGIAACLVVLYHFTPADKLPLAPLRNAIGRGYLWVDLFFVLSGFVIALNYSEMFRDGFRFGAFGKFLIRRVARLYPLYLALLAAKLAYTLAAYGGFAFHNDPNAAVLDHPAVELPINLLMIQSWGIGGSVVTSSWSISTEVAVYLAFPILAAMILSRHHREWALAMVVLAVCLLLAVMLLDHQDGENHRGALDAWDGRLLTPLMRCFAGFMLGLVTWRVSRSARISRLMGDERVGGAVAIALLILLGAGAPDLVIVAMFPPLILHLAESRRSIPARLFASKTMVFAGALSYAIYLLHPLFEPALYDLADWLSGRIPALAAAGVSGTLIVACLLASSAFAHFCIERPGRRWVMRVFKPLDLKGHSPTLHGSIPVSSHGADHASRSDLEPHPRHPAFRFRRHGGSPRLSGGPARRG